ncbi:MAG: MarR family transcriptional regulator, partial [Nitrososphaerales archaeon]
QRLWDQNLHAAGLSLTELRVLKLLSGSGPSPMARIAADLSMTPASMTGLVDRLEEEGFVTRERSSRDRRVVSVAITEEGSERFQRGRVLHRRLVEKTLRALTEEEAEELVRSLSKLSRAAETEDA